MMTQLADSPFFLGQAELDQSKQPYVPFTFDCEWSNECHPCFYNGTCPPCYFDNSCWETKPKPIDKTGPEQHNKEKPIEADAQDGRLSPGIVLTFMILSAIWKLAIISLIGTGLQIIIELYILIDWIWDLFCRFLIKPILTEYGAIIFIWLFKIPTLPILIVGAFFRLFLEIMGFPISGWMLFFGGSGCFLRWGNDCWFATHLSEKRYWQIADLPIFMKQPFVNLFHVPLLAQRSLGG